MNDPKTNCTRLIRSVVLASAVMTNVCEAGETGIDSAAVEKLKVSLNYLAGLERFAMESSSTIEVVLQDGQKLQFDNAIRATVQRPAKFHAERLGDLVDQEFFYDGKNLTLQDATAGYHASMTAPGTLEGMLAFARASLDIVAPAGDFIYGNAFEILMEGVESAAYLGLSYVEGQVCDHLAFSAPGNETDFQVWIQRGDKPLPRRIVITARDVLNAPQFVVHIHEWDVNPDVTKELFEFNAADSSTEIKFIVLNADQDQQ